jgi:outer membrane biosynthesis protein TonB
MRSRFTLTPEGRLGKLRQAVAIAACGLVVGVGGCGGDDRTQQARLPNGGDVVLEPPGEPGGDPRAVRPDRDLPERGGTNPPEPTAPEPEPAPPEPEPTPPEPEPTPPLEDPEAPDDPAGSDVTP